MTTPYEPSTAGRSSYPLDDSTDSTAEFVATTDFDSRSSTSSSASSGSAAQTAAETAKTAAEQAGQVKDSAAQAAGQVSQTAKEQAANVADDVRQQARQLADETGQQLHEQAVSQRDRAVSGLRSLGEELGSMSQSSEQSGLGSQLARSGSQMSHQAADFLEKREPGDLLEDIRSLARRRPGAFLVGAAAAGIVAGRLTRGVMSARSNDSGSSDFASGDGYDSARVDAVSTPAYQPTGVTRPDPGSEYAGTVGDPLSYEGTSISGRGAATGVEAGGTLSAAPILDEPYGEVPPPSGYSNSSAGSR